MIDLTNKSVDEINGLIQKYAQVLETVPHKEQPYFAYIMDIAVNHIETNHKNLNSDWKAWSTFVLRKLHGKIKTESDIKKIIDDFVEYQKNEYRKYCDDLVISLNDYDKDRGFVYKYIWKKNR
jgi:hypothetical protein